MTMRRILCAVVIVLLISQAAWSNDKNAAKELLVSKIDAALTVLQKKDLVQHEKNKQVIKIVEPIFNYNLMAKLSMGKYWRGLSEKNKEKFTELFIDRLKTTYVDKLSLYTNEKVEYETPVQDNKGKIKIPTKVISKGKNFSMLYKLYKFSQGWMIYDIEIEGISLISTYRSQFYDILGKGTIDDLLLKLEKPEIK